MFDEGSHAHKAVSHAFESIIHAYSRSHAKATEHYSLARSHAHQHREHLASTGQHHLISHFDSEVAPVFRDAERLIAKNATPVQRVIGKVKQFFRKNEDGSEEIDMDEIPVESSYPEGTGVHVHSPGKDHHGLWGTVVKQSAFYPDRIAVEVKEKGKKKTIHVEPFEVRRQKDVSKSDSTENTLSKSRATLTDLKRRNRK